jgi:hypothetical protein
MKRILTLAFASLILIAPAAAFGQHNAGTSAHMRPQLFHDRTPRAHVHTVAAHH